jgi:two-component system cell cycle response regulator DivK
VLAVTAYAGKGDEQRIREVGAEGYLASRSRSGRSWQRSRGSSAKPGLRTWLVNLA